MIAGAPGLKMPAFSIAIFSTVSPRNSGWSREIEVTMVALGALDHIGRVIAPAEPRLEQQPVGLRLAEQQKSRGRGDLEEGDRLLAVGPLAAFKSRLQRRVLDDLAAALRAKPDAFVEAKQMRRGVDMHARALRFQHRAQEGERRALAIRAGDVNRRRQPQIGTAQRRQAGARRALATGRSSWGADREDARGSRRADPCARGAPPD